MANCTQCGTELKDNIRFCTECGAAVPAAETDTAEERPAAAQPVPASAPQPQAVPDPQPATEPPPRPQPAPQPVYQAAPTYAVPAYAGAVSDAPPAGSRYELISTGGFIGIMLLMCIPIIGQIIMIVWAFGGCRKLQKRNLSRAALIVMAVMLIISLLLGFAAKRLFNSAMEDIGITQSERGDALGGLLGGEEKDGGPGGVWGMIGALGGGSVENGDLEELQELLGQLEGLTGDDMGGDELFGRIDDLGGEAARNSDG